MIDREAALELLREPGPESHLVQHALASEAVMRALARHFGENEELWGLTGLLHDWDYPLTADEPARHGLESAEKLKDSLPEEALQAIRAHNAECNGCTEKENEGQGVRRFRESGYHPSVCGYGHDARRLPCTGH